MAYTTLQDMIRSVVNKLLTRRYHKPLELAAVDEEQLLKELRKEFRDLPQEDTTHCLPSEKAWRDYLNRIRDLVLNSNPREFLRWDVITGTMFVGNDRYIIEELNYLKQRSDWNTRWREAIAEVTAGNPLPFKKYPESSGNLIHHAYHISQFEEKTGVQVDSVNFVLEFGGGYGSMCRLFGNLGFKGKYVIFDFPHLTALQKYFLRSIGIAVHKFEHVQSAGHSVVCISDLEKLKMILSTYREEENSLFIATWSISETPMSFRDSVLSLVSNFNSYLIAYQDNFGEVNNMEYFEKYKSNHQNRIKWNHWEIRHLPGNTYLVGIRVVD